jgi:uncharacterized protein
MDISGGRSRIIDTVLLKVASRCNLDCSYCYVYHMGDEAWRYQPKRMPDDVMNLAAAQLGQLYREQTVPFSVVLHGGEPLLIGRERLDDLCATLRAELPHPCGIHLQTNGVLLTDDVLDVLVEYDVGISISIDGPPEVHDRFRVDRAGRGSHQRVEQAIARIMVRDDARPLFAGILSVVDPTTSAGRVYDYLKSTGAPSLDFLVRDGNWDKLPFGKAGPPSTEYGEWLRDLLHLYIADPCPPRIRILDDMLRLLLGGISQKEGVGSTDYGILIIEPDGRIDKNDTLKVAHPGADLFGDPWTLFTHRLADIVRSAEFDDYYRQQRPTAAECQSCDLLTVCGGGMVAHRWSQARSFDNPTIFCADQKLLIRAMQSVLATARAA